MTQLHLIVTVLAYKYNGGIGEDLRPYLHDENYNVNIIYLLHNSINFWHSVPFFWASGENHQYDEFCLRWKRERKTVSDFY